jgi:hypothetical protein
VIGFFIEAFLSHCLEPNLEVFGCVLVDGLLGVWWVCAFFLLMSIARITGETEKLAGLRQEYEHLFEQYSK